MGPRSSHIGVLVEDDRDVVAHGDKYYLHDDKDYAQDDKDYAQDDKCHAKGDKYYLHDDNALFHQKLLFFKKICYNRIIKN